MPESSLPLYEGLFLMNQQAFAGDLTAALDRVRDLLGKAGAEIVSLRKWDERKLAYPIQGQKRGLFLLTLFRVAGDQIARIERDCYLSDDVLRVLITRADHMGETEIQQEIKASQTTAAEARLRGTGEGAAPSRKPAGAEPADEAAQASASSNA